MCCENYTDSTVVVLVQWWKLSTIIYDTIVVMKSVSNVHKCPYTSIVSLLMAWNLINVDYWGRVAGLSHWLKGLLPTINILEALGKFLSPHCHIVTLPWSNCEMWSSWEYEDILNDTVRNCSMSTGLCIVLPGQERQKYPCLKDNVLWKPSILICLS